MRYVSHSTRVGPPPARARDRKSTRLNSSHGQISYAVFCLKKKIRPATLIAPRHFYHPRRPERTPRQANTETSNTHRARICSTIEFQGSLVTGHLLATECRL